MPSRGNPLLAAIPVLLSAIYVHAQQPIRATTEDGRTVLLSTDGTWKLVPPPVRTSPNSTPTASLAEYHKSPSAKKAINPPYGGLTLWIDDKKWRESTSNGSKMFQHTNGKLYATYISEALPNIATSSLRDVALINAQRLDPNAAIVREERRIVNGREVLCLELKASNGGIAFHFMGYYHGGAESTFQVAAFTAESEFAQQKGEIEEFLNGLEVREKSAPEVARNTAGEIEASVAYGKFRLNYPTQKWSATKIRDSNNWSFKLKNGEAYATFIPERTEIPLDSLIEIALDRIRQQDFAMTIVKQETRTIGGVRLKILRIDASPNGIPLSYLNLYYGGPAGALQILCWSGRNTFPEYQSTIEDFLKGVIIDGLLP